MASSRRNATVATVRDDMIGYEIIERFPDTVDLTPVVNIGKKT